MKTNFKLPKLLVVFFLSLIISSCSTIKGTGPLVIEERKLEEFKSIDLAMNADVYLIQGDTPNVIIKAQQNIMEVIKTEVTRGKIEIKASESISASEPIQLWVTLKTIDDVELSGSGNIMSTTNFNAEKISTSVSGSGKINLVLTCEKLIGDISGSGAIYLKGKISTGDFDISGSGNIFAKDCQIDKCKIDINGSGAAKLNVLGELISSINGSGEILYTGNPHNVKSNISGSGHVSKME